MNRLLFVTIVAAVLSLVAAATAGEPLSAEKRQAIKEVEARMVYLAQVLAAPNTPWNHHFAEQFRELAAIRRELGGGESKPNSSEEPPAGVFEGEMSVIWLYKPTVTDRVSLVVNGRDYTVKFATSDDINEAVDAARNKTVRVRLAGYSGKHPRQGWMLHVDSGSLEILK